VIRIGLTGTLGAGKSAVAELFERWGARRIDADRLAREAVRPGGQVLAEIRRLWGDDVLDERGELDRAVMRRLVFRDPDARRRLESIVHPEVRGLRDRRLEEARSAGAAVVVEEIPLLFEVGLEDQFDAVIVVDAPTDVRRERVSQQRGLGADEFHAMDASQLSAEEKRERADYVLENGGSPEALEAAARRIWAQIVDAESSTDSALARWKVDLHVHTSYSHDSLSAPEAVIERARRAGLSRVAVTDHNEIDGALLARELAPDLVIVGEEVRTAEGLDLIGLFLDERIPRGLRFEEVAAEIRRQGAIVYLPHPFDRYRGAKPSFLDGVVEWVDVVEGLNARVHSRRRNERAVAWARAHELPLGAGSDAHLLGEVGRAWVELPSFEDAPGFLEATRRGRIGGRRSGHWVHLGSTWAKLGKKAGFLA
jgi:dephospho-CoA kinase